MINLNGMTYYENITIIEFYDAPDEDSLTYDFSLFESSNIIAVHLYYECVDDLDCSDELREKIYEEGVDNDLIAIYNNCQAFVRWETISTNLYSSFLWQEGEDTISIYLYNFED